MKKTLIFVSLCATLTCTMPALADQGVIIDKPWQEVAPQPAPYQGRPSKPLPEVQPPAPSDVRLRNPSSEVQPPLPPQSEEIRPRFRNEMMPRQMEGEGRRQLPPERMNPQIGEPISTNQPNFREQGDRGNRNWDRGDRGNRNWERERRRDRDFEAGAAAIGIFTTIIDNAERRRHHREMREMREQRMMDRGNRGNRGMYPCRVYDEDSGQYVSGKCWGKQPR